MKYALLVLTFLISQIVASQTIKIDDQFSSITPVLELSYVVDLEHNFNKNSIVNQTFKPAIKNNFGIRKGNYWFKLKIENSTNASKKIFFDIRDAIVSQVKVYKIVNGKLGLIYNLNKNIIKKNAYQLNQNLSIPITLTESGSSQLYINVTFPKTAFFPLTLRSEQNEAKTMRYSLLRNGFYYGFAFMVFIVNLFFFVSLKDNIFLYYLAFLIAITSSLLYYDAFFYEVLEQGWLLYNIDSFIHFFMGLTGALFATNFLQLPIYFKTINKIGIVFLTILAVLYFVQIVTDNFLFLAMADALGFILLTIYWVTGVLLLKKHDYARFFVLGYSLVLIVGVFYIIPLDFGFQGFGFSLDHLKLGGMVEMLFLTYAATYRLRVLKEENLSMENAIKRYITRVLHLEKSLHIVNKKEATKQSFTEKLLALAKNHALTDREIDVLECLTQGLSYEKIAIALFVSKNTIKYHTRNIYEKIGVKTSIEITSKLTV